MPLLSFESDCDFKCSTLTPFIEPGGGPFAAWLVVIGLGMRGMKETIPKVSTYGLKRLLVRYSEARYGEADILRRASWKKDIERMKVGNDVKWFAIYCLTILAAVGYVYSVHHNFPSCNVTCLRQLP